MAKYCARCGKQINEKAVFCKYCGEKVVFSEPTNGVSGNKYIDKNTREDINRISADIENERVHKPVNTPGVNPADEKVPKKMIAIVAVAVALVIVTAAVGAIMYFGKTNDATSSGNTETMKGDEITEVEADEANSSQSVAVKKDIGNAASCECFIAA